MYLSQAPWFTIAAAAAAADSSKSGSQPPEPLAAGEQLSPDPRHGCARRRGSPLESATFVTAVAAGGDAPVAAEPTHQQGVELCEVNLRCRDRVCSTTKGTQYLRQPASLTVMPR